MFIENNRINTLLKVALISIFSSSLILFVIASIGDIDFNINKELEILMDYKFFKFWAALWASLGSAMPIAVGFIVMSIWVETYFIRLRKGYYNENNIHSFLKKHWVFVTIIWYALFLLIRLWMNFDWLASSASNVSVGWGANNDVRVQGSNIYRYISKAITILLETSSVVIFAILSHTVFERKETFVKSNQWFIGVKIAIFFFYSYSMIYFFKHFFGRPYYFSVVYDEMEEKMKAMGWIEASWSPYGKAEYFPWYIPNNLFENLQYWFTTPPRRSELNDQYWNMDFPSGHTTAATILASTIAFFDRRDKKQNYKFFMFWYITSIILVLNMAFTMVYYRFHWTTDVAWSLFTSVVMWLMAQKTATLVLVKPILKVNALNNVQSLGLVYVSAKSNTQTLLLCYYGNLIKVRLNKKREKCAKSTAEKYMIRLVGDESLEIG